MGDVLQIIHNDALSALRELPDESVQCVVTSPPYFGLRDYGVEPRVWDETVECQHEFVESRQYQDSPVRSGAEGVGFHDAETTKAQRWRTHGACVCGAWHGCLGLEPTPDLYVDHLVQILREARRAMRSDGTLWLNIGDSYSSASNGRPQSGLKALSDKCSPRKNPRKNHAYQDRPDVFVSRPVVATCKPKDLIGIPWMLAFALRGDGWYLRSDIIWNKPNPMPESVTDRPTKSHEYIFLLSKSERYFFNAEAVREKASHAGQVISLGAKSMSRGQAAGMNVEPSGNGKAESYTVVEGRNIRSVWTITTQPFPGAHFAVFPTDIPRRCVLAGSKHGDVILDPFAGSGTTGKVAIELGRKAILIEPKAEYVEMIKRRTQTTMGLPLAV
ncbi:MAG TPA: site-specific DNA-methyltransferase [Pyrinomonadaceae bacterium]|nr:site-specific DNA-methyltransferase [Pyrinomonadaceae bacterium]